MSSSRPDLRSEFIDLDTNEYLLALRRDERFAACSDLVFDRTHELRIHMPLQVLKEMSRALRRDELRRVFDALEVSAEFRPDYTTGDPVRVAYWESRGAKKGDAVITAQLEASGVRYLVSENRHFLGQSENRHFLGQIADLPFEVLTAEDLLQRLADS